MAIDTTLIDKKTYMQYYSITKVKYYLKSLKTFKLRYLTSTADLIVTVTYLTSTADLKIKIDILDVHNRPEI